MEVAIISDTHVPSRSPGIPPWVRERVGAADHTIHAGDFDSAAALETVTELADGDLTAVAGNMDRLDLPETARVVLGGVEFVVHHGTGDLAGYRERVVEAVRSARNREGAVGVCGHTHEHTDEVVRGVRLLNPGSATGADPAEAATMMTARVGDGRLDVTLHRE
ncbi:MAG: metallophosphoesterase family protein [Haloferacaceae archaeon]